MRTSILFVMLWVVCYAVVSCNTKGPAGLGTSGTPVEEYLVLPILPKSTTLFYEFPATIQGQQNIEIRPKIDGYVDMIYVDEGATVKKGQALFRISAPQYEQDVRTAQADILIAEADVSAAEMQVDKVRPLVEKHIISKYELQGAQYTLQSRQAALAQAHARLENARTNLGYAAIESPVNGVIGTIPYKIGSLVSPGTVQPLTTVSNIGNIYAYFSVNEKEVLQFTKDTAGASLQDVLAGLPPVSLLLANGAELSKQGKIDAAGGLINTETGSFNIRAVFPNPGKIIHSGSSGTLRLPQHVDSALLIPQRVTYEMQGKKFVFVLDSSGTVRSTEINVMSGDNGQYYVVNKGLRPGDRILLEGVSTLRDGTTIKPKMANADSVYRRMSL